jgi:hypothetical protein
MPSTYTTNLGLEKPATGEQAGVWGNTVDNDFDFIDQATDGNLVVALSSSTYILATSPGVASPGRAKVITFTGTLTANAAVTITPNTAQKLYYVRNLTTGGFSINFSQGSGAAFTLAPNCSAAISCDGNGSTASVTGALFNPQFGTVTAAALVVNGPASTTFGGPVTLNGAVTATAAVNLQATTTVNNLIIAVAGYAAAAGDMYYRISSGVVVPLPIGSPGQTLQVSSSHVPAWVTVPGVGIGSPIVGSNANAIYYSSASNALAQDPGNFDYAPGNGLGVGAPNAYWGGIQVGPSVPPVIALDANDPSTQQRSIYFTTGTGARWIWYTPVAAETGGNANSNLLLSSFDDSGAGITQCMTWIRSNGHVTVGLYADGGAQFAVYSQTSGVPAILARGAGTGQIQLWQNPSGTNVAWIDTSGNLTIGGQSQFNQHMLIMAGAAGVTTLDVRAIAGQTWLMTWQNPSGGWLASMDTSGNFACGNLGVTATNTNPAITVRNNGSGWLQAWQNSAGSVNLAYLDSQGNFHCGNAAVVAATASGYALTVAGVSGISYLQVWQQNSSGGTMGWLDINGNFYCAGSANLSAGVTTSSITSTGITVNGNVNITGSYEVNGVPIGQGIKNIQLQGNGTNYASIGGPGQTSPFINLVTSGTLTVSSDGGGAGGGGWILGTTSDARLKRNIRDATGGLDLINRIHVIEAEYNGLAGTVAGRRIISALTQELQLVIPEAVCSYQARLNPKDAERTELLGLDLIPVVFQAVLAIQQLDERLRKYEGL